MKTIFEKPFMLSVGPQRAGSHFIYDYLHARGDVCLPAGVKEIFFFDRHFQRGSGFYESHFPVRSHHNLIAEISTTIFDHPDVPGRVNDLFGKDISLVCPLRHPVERSLAVYEDYLRYGIVSGGIEEAVHQAPQILFASRYADHLARWIDVFGADHIKILYYEDAQDDLQGYLRSVCEYVALPYIVPTAEKGLSAFLHKFTQTFKPKNMLTKVQIQRRKAARSWLEQSLKSEISKLETLLERRLDVWRG